MVEYVIRLAAPLRYRLSREIKADIIQKRRQSSPSAVAERALIRGDLISISAVIDNREAAA